MGERTCSIDDCDSPTAGRGWCRKHYMRWNRHGDPLRGRAPREPCVIPECWATRFGHGYCEKHYNRWRIYGSTDLRPDPRRIDLSAGDGLRSCTECLVLLPEDSFDRDGSRWDGRSRTCKNCDKANRKARETADAVEARKARRKKKRDAALEAERAKRRSAYAANPSRERAFSQARRAAKKGAGSEVFADIEIFQRDGWICGLCGSPIDPSLRWPNPQSVSLDHVTPLARGGVHARDNAQAAHLTCNLRKGARMSA